MKIRFTILTIFLLVAMLWSAGCRKYPRIVGNNKVEIENRTLVSFDRIRNEGTFNVYIRHDSIHTATIEAESNLIPHIRTIVEGNTLVIDTRENLKSNYSMNVYVTAPIIRGASLSGSGYIHLDSIDTDYMEVEISGSGEIEGYVDADNSLARISGSGNIYLDCFTQSLDARISGSGNLDIVGFGDDNKMTISGSGQIRSYNFEQNHCEARISGSGDMFLNVMESLKVDISGSGSIYYIGDPALNISITGSGNVFKQ